MSSQEQQDLEKFKAERTQIRETAFSAMLDTLQDKARGYSTKEQTVVSTYKDAQQRINKLLAEHVTCLGKKRRIKMKHSTWENISETVAILRNLSDTMYFNPSSPQECLGKTILENAIEHLRSENMELKGELKQWH